MQIGLRLVIAGTVILTAAGIALFMVTGEATSFNNFTSSNRKSAQCTIYHERWKNSLNCGYLGDSEDSTSVSTTRSENIKQKRQGHCPNKNWEVEEVCS